MFSARKDNHGADPRPHREFSRRRPHYLLKMHDLPFTRFSVTHDEREREEDEGNEGRELDKVDVGEKCREITNIIYILSFIDTNLFSIIKIL